MEFTREEVAEHRSEKDCWMVIHGKAYDITSVLTSHPGGAECLMDCAGVDGTLAFDDVGHSSYAWGTLKDCYKGEVPDSPTLKRTKGLPDRPLLFGMNHLLYPILSIIGLTIYIMIQYYKWS